MRAEDRHCYGYHWRRHVRPPILARAAGKCEHCGKRNPLDVAHLDGVPGHDDPDNLAALCRKCHARLDYRKSRPKAAETRKEQKDRARPIIEFIQRGMAAQAAVDAILEAKP